MSEQLALLPGFLIAHLQLSLTALLIGAVISIPLGLAVTRRPRLEGSVLGVASVLQTIPSLALLAIMVPTLAALGALTARAFGIEIRSIGFLPALVALALYSLLPMLRNTVTGIRAVDPFLLEAARGVGMTTGQQLRLVELPLAMPVIVAGLRTAAVWVVGTATLSTPVGATSLGNFIFSGLQTRNFEAVLVGCIASALLAITLDQLIRAIEAGYAERRPVLRGLGTLGLGLLYAVAAVAFAADRAKDEVPVRVGAKSFTEQYVLSEIIADVIERETGERSIALPSLGSTVAFDALRTGEIDAYVDYTGTVWATIMKRDTLPERREEVSAEVASFLAEEHGIELVASLGFENTYALGMRASQVRELGLRTISDLVAHAPGLVIGGDFEFFARAEWTSLRDRYGLRFREQRSMDPSLMYPAVRQGEVDVISAYSTEGRIAAFDLALLEDDLGVIPPYEAILLASGRLVRERPEVVDALRGLAGALDADTMQRLNFEVDGDGRSPRAVAESWARAR